MNQSETTIATASQERNTNLSETLLERFAPIRYKVGAMTTKQGTSSIGPKQAARVFHAVRFATSIGRPLNLLVTIDTSTLGIKDEDASKFVREVWARLTRWWAYQRIKKNRQLGEFAAIVVHENPDGGPRHAHWLMHVPEEARDDVERIIRSRIEKLAGLACLGRAVHFHHDVNAPGKLAKYMLKGVDPDYAAHFHMEAVDQGMVLGRRMTVSRSIGYTARERAGWKRKRSRPGEGPGHPRLPLHTSPRRTPGASQPLARSAPQATPRKRVTTAISSRPRSPPSPFHS